jgi:Flp pilus assembly protein TadD
VVVFPDNWLPYYGVNPYYSYYGYGYGSGYYPYAYSYPYYYGGPFWIPPVVMPAETLYGPQATMRFMGVDNLSRSANNMYVPRTGSTTPAVERPSKPASARGTGAKSLASAQDYMRFGDTKFADRKYAEASQRYRKATQIAPQLADPWFRQGFAQAAIGDKDPKRYELAAVAIRRGLELKPEWPKSNFRVSELYGGDDQAKTDHIEALAKAAEAQPNNGDLMFLLGVHLYFDGRPDRAAPFFKRAAELAAGDRSHLRPFLGSEE